MLIGMRRFNFHLGVSVALSVAIPLLLCGSAQAEQPPRRTNPVPAETRTHAISHPIQDVTIVVSGRAKDDNDKYLRESGLRARVAANLAASRSLSGSDIVVTSTDGTVVLNGSVAERRDLDRAELIAGRTPAVAGVVNQLRVKPDVDTPTEVIDDAELAKRVSTQLAVEFQRARLERRWKYGYGVKGEAMDVTVDADDGEVLLSGSVPSYDALGRAVSIARAVPGVHAARSHLQIDVGEVPASVVSP
jgi:osmotically-inducible protein OsmY